VGGKVSAVNRVAIDEVLAWLSRYWPGEGQANDVNAVEHNTELCLWLEYGEAEELRLRIESGGRTAQHIVRPIPQDELRPAVRRETPMQGWWARSFDVNRVAILRVDGFVAPLQEVLVFEKFLAEAFREFSEKGVTALIIDLRRCGGGSSQSSDAMLRYLTDKPFRQVDWAQLRFTPQLCKVADQYGVNLDEFTQDVFAVALTLWVAEHSIQMGSNVHLEGKLKDPGTNPWRFQGQVFLLIGPQTYSAGVTFSAAVKHYGLATLVGQTTVDSPANYGIAYGFKLPHSGLAAMAATGFIVAPGAQKGCGGVVPHHVVRQSVEDTANEIDSVLEFTRGLIESSKA